MAKVVHYGFDSCHRIPLLSSAGFEVAGCDSASGIRRLLMAAPYDAVLFAEFPSAPLLRITRSFSTAPLIWFPADPLAIADDRFDLVIPPLTPPREWIASIRKLLTETRRIHAESIRPDSVTARKETHLRIERLRDSRRTG